MPLPEAVEVKFGNLAGGTKEVTHYVLFNAWAIRALERVSGMSIGRLGLMVVTGRAGVTEQIYMVYAGLEGARWRFKPAHHPEPFTVDEACQLIDDTMTMQDFRDGADHPMNAAVMRAWKSAFPDKNRAEEGAGDQPGNPPVSAPPEG